MPENAYSMDNVGMSSLTEQRQALRHDPSDRFTVALFADHPPQVMEHRRSAPAIAQTLKDTKALFVSGAGRFAVSLRVGNVREIAERPGDARQIVQLTEDLQVAATARALPAVSSNDFWTDCARSTNNCTLS